MSRRFDQVERALPTTHTSDSARFSENYFNVCKCEVCRSVLTTLLLVDAKIMVSSNCPIIGEQVAVIQGHLKFSKV